MNRAIAEFACCLLLCTAPNIPGRAQAETPAQITPAPAIDLLVTVTDTPEAGPRDTGKDTYIPGSDVIYTVVVTNRGTQAIKGVLVKGPLPAGISKASWVCSTSAGGVCGARTGSASLSDQVDLAPRAAATYLVTLSVPADYAAGHAALTYTVSLTPPPGAVDVAPDNLSATDSDVARPPGGSAPLQSPTVGAGAGGTGVSSLRGRPSLGGALPGFLGEAPFVCDPTMYVSVGTNGTSPTSLLVINTAVSPFGSTVLGTASIAYNGMGFNPINNFIYAFENGTTKLYQIHSDGSATVVGSPLGLPAPANGYTAAEIDPNGIMYVKEQNSTTVLYTIDLKGTAPYVAKKFNVTNSLAGAADFAWVNGLLYTVLVNMAKATATVATIDPVSGTVTYLPFINNNFTNNVGALFGGSAGLFGLENGATSGTFLEFDLTTGQAITLSSTGFPVGNSDGAHCASASLNFNTDLQVTKTNTPAQGPNDLPNDTYNPGTVVYTIVVTNNGPTGVQNAPVRDPLPAGITTASWTCAATGHGVCGAANGSGGIVDEVDLEVGDTATYLLTMTVPASYPVTHPALTNTVTIAMPPGFVSPNPSHLTATDTDPAGVDLAVVKTTAANSVAVGGVLSYTITVSNQGKADVANSVLTDTPDSRLDCTSVSPNVTCTAAGTAQCPSGTVTVASLLGSGVTIPLLPASTPPGTNTATFTMSCKVTSATATQAAKVPAKK